MGWWLHIGYNLPKKTIFTWLVFYIFSKWIGKNKTICIDKFFTYILQDPFSLVFFECVIYMRGKKKVYDSNPNFFPILLNRTAFHEDWPNIFWRDSPHNLISDLCVSMQSKDIIYLTHMALYPSPSVFKVNCDVNVIKNWMGACLFWKFSTSYEYDILYNLLS